MYESDEEKFKSSFSEIVKEAYQPLFDVYGEDAWNTDYQTLVSFFRREEKVNQKPGERRASLFTRLAELAGKRQRSESSRTRSGSSATKTREGKSAESRRGSSTKSSSTSGEQQLSDVANRTSSTPSVGVSVKVEINLPGNQSKETYDYIFKSIKENLLD